MTGKAPLTVLLPVLNEELNLPAALESVAFADEVVVIDSASTDRTAEIAASAGARVVQFDFQRAGRKKKAWALEELDVRNPWVLLLDADERLTAELRAEILATIDDPQAEGYCIDRELVFMGRSLRCFSPNWNLRLFRAGSAHVEDLGLHDVPRTGDNEIHEHIEVEGPIGFLSSPLLHDDDRGLTAWLERHNKYATWEAHLYRKLRREPIGMTPLELLRIDAFQRKRALRRIWVRLPFRPALRFVTWYFGRRGFLDGRQGFVFCVLMAYYEFIIGAKLRELARDET